MGVGGRRAGQREVGVTDDFGCLCGSATLDVRISAAFPDCIRRERRCAWCGERVLTEERVVQRPFRGGDIRRLGGKRRRQQKRSRFGAY